MVKVTGKGAYTGSEVTLDGDDIEVRFGAEVLDYGEDYEVVEGSYRENRKKGTATAMLAGKGEYGGMKAVKFKIVPQDVTVK